MIDTQKTLTRAHRRVIEAREQHRDETGVYPTFGELLVLIGGQNTAPLRRKIAELKAAGEWRKPYECNCGCGDEVSSDDGFSPGHEPRFCGDCGRRLSDEYLARWPNAVVCRPCGAADQPGRDE